MTDEIRYPIIPLVMPSSKKFGAPLPIHQLSAAYTTPQLSNGSLGQVSDLGFTIV